MRAPTLELPPYPCQPEDYQPGDGYRVPHYLPGENPYLTESAFKYKAPLDGMRGGGETLYPAWRAKGTTLAPPATQSTLRPVYSDESTRIAERADAQRRGGPPVYDKVEALHVAGNVYVIAGAGGNIAISAGGDGVVMVDAGAAAASDRVLAAVRQVVQTLRPPDAPDAASPFASSWQAAHALPEPMIRMIINTSSNPDHVGGNANIRMSPMFRLLGFRDPSLSLQVLAHELVQRRMLESKAADDCSSRPTRTPPTQYTLYRFLNNQAVQTLSHAQRRHRRRQRGVVPPLGCDRRRRRVQQRHLSADRRRQGRHHRRRNRGAREAARAVRH